MKVLYFSDVHASEKALEWARVNAERYDAVVVGGDLGRPGAKGFAARFLAGLSSTGKNVYFVPGNADSSEVAVQESVVSLHGKRAMIGGMSVGGLGGSNITGMGTPFELDDGEARRLLEKIGKVEILVAHCPPVNTKCDIAGGRHIGSVPVREYVEKNSPVLVLSGHAHESRAVDRIGWTTVVNAGPMMNGNYAEILLGSVVSVELKSGAF